MVYFSNDINDGWNGLWRGKTTNDGVYVFIIEYNDGVKNYLKKGDVTIIK